MQRCLLLGSVVNSGVVLMDRFSTNYRYCIHQIIGFSFTYREYFNDNLWLMIHWEGPINMNERIIYDIVRYHDDLWLYVFRGNIDIVS